MLVVGIPACQSSGATASSSDAISVGTGAPRVDDLYCPAEQSAAPPPAGPATPNTYALFDVYLKNLPEYITYFNRGSKLVAAHQGRIAMRNVNFLNTLEGSAPLQAFNIVEFPSQRNFDDFYCSPEYQPDVRKLRLDATKVIYSVVEVMLDLSESILHRRPTT